MKRFWTALSISSLVLSMGISILFTVEATTQNNNLAEIAQGNMAEIAAGNLALQRSQNEQVRQFAQQMVADHTTAATELQTLASGKNITLPAAMADKQKSGIDKLGGRSGADFDREFMKMMVKDHERMERLLSREAQGNSDADVKAFAAKTLPVVQNHLTMARSLDASLRGRSGGNTGSDTTTNMNRSGNTNGNDDDNDNDGSGAYSNLRPNVNRSANMNGNTDTNMNSDMNMNSNSNNNRRRNRNSNSNSNSNRNTNNNTNSNVNRR
jgi:putative membrane protein